jgi:hypothetical protein
MTHRIPAVIEMIRTLNAAGVAAPPKPFVGFHCDVIDGDPPASSPGRALDPEYQRQLDVWVSQVEYLHRRHIGERGN